MPIQGSAREGEWPSLFVPVAVLLASVVTCSAMPPADAGPAPSACRVERASPWVGRAASAAIVERARAESGAETVELVMPDESLPAVYRVDRLNLVLDERSIIADVACG